MDINLLDLIGWIIGVLIILWFGKDRKEIEILLTLTNVMIFTIVWIVIFGVIDLNIIDGIHAIFPKDKEINWTL